MSAPTQKIPVLFLGATGTFVYLSTCTTCSPPNAGYVGGTFLSRILAAPSLADKLDLTLYVRSPEKAQRLTSEFGLKTVVGTLADLIGITPANLAVLKNGRAKAVRFSTLDALCQALDCQPGDLLRFEPEG